MSETLGGKVALVTGGARAIGRATSLALAREGAKVVVSDILVDSGEETASMIRDAGGEAIFAGANASKEDEVGELVRKTVDAYGRLDCAFNNAGIEGEIKQVADGTVANFDQVIGVNLKGTWLCMRAEIRQMLTQGGGAIVNVASIAGLIGFPGLSPYVATKHAVNGLTRTAAVEYSKHGIRTNAVCPGAIDTPMIHRIAEGMGAASADEVFGPLHPIGRMGKPQEVAEAVVWLCSDAASFVTGACIPVDGGFVAQ